MEGTNIRPLLYYTHTNIFENIDLLLVYDLYYVEWNLIIDKPFI